MEEVEPTSKYPDGTTFTLSVPEGLLSSNYRAEVQALNAATEHLIDRGGNGQNIVLLTDSLSALQSLMSGPTYHFTRQLQNNLEALSQHSKVVLQWILAHVETRGNEMADMLVKADSQLQQPDRSTSYNEAKTVLKQKFKTNWQNRHHSYCPQHDHINILEQTTIFLLCIVVSRNTRKRLGLQRQHSVNRHQSTFSRSAHSMKRNVVKFELMTPRSTPNSGGTSTTYEGRLASPTPLD